MFIKGSMDLVTTIFFVDKLEKTRSNVECDLSFWMKLCWFRLLRKHQEEISILPASGYEPVGLNTLCSFNLRLVKIPN